MPGNTTGSLERYLTLSEAAELLQVSERTLWGLAKNQVVPHFRVGKQYRFIASKLFEWAEQQSEGQRGPARVSDDQETSGEARRDSTTSSRAASS